MRTLSRAIVLAVIGTLVAAGCARSPVSGGQSGSILPGLGSKQGLAAEPKVAPTYSDLSKDFQNRPLSSPAIGLDESPTPSVWKRMGASVAAAPKRVAVAAKSAGAKTKAAFTPDPAPVVASTAPAVSNTPSPEAGPDIYVASAIVYERTGNFAAAAQQYEKALALAPNHLPTLLSYAHMLDRQNNLEQACALYERAIKFHPKEAATYNDLGLCLARRGMLHDAGKVVSKAVELQPDRPLYRNNLAAIYVEQRRPEDALDQLKATQPEAVACYNLGYLLAQRGQDAIASTYFNRAVQIEPGFADARAWSDRLAARSAPQPAIATQSEGTAAQVAGLPSTAAVRASANMPVQVSNWDAPRSGIGNGEPLRTSIHTPAATTTIVR